MLCGGSRVLQHLSDYHQYTPIGLGLGFCGAEIVQLSPFFLRPSQAMANGHLYVNYKLTILEKGIVVRIGFQDGPQESINVIFDVLEKPKSKSDWKRFVKEETDLEFSRWRKVSLRVHEVHILHENAPNEPNEYEDLIFSLADELRLR
ncbi:unnamed protein product [Arabis nemorensis]|uniref:Uncharacterized protein n=1 Tax=Arabis nemorensis TaxID=586526 RepID=A0A565CJK0_9BRAS|nr:unnamed protein product [Arabis nemorensis]